MSETDTGEEGPAIYRFLPWVREGFAPTTGVDPLEGPITDPGTVDFSFSIVGEDPHPDPEAPPRDPSVPTTADATVSLDMYGPGDIVGVDHRQVVRVEPKPGTTEFPPNYFAFVEFDRPDLPWLFTPAVATTEGKLTPWVCLVTVRKQEGVTISVDERRPLPVLEIESPADPSEELPDLSEAYGWAHAQVVGDETTPLNKVLRTLPTADLSADEVRDQSKRTLSRLISPRRLVEKESYYACVVPTYEPGRKAGLGLEPFPVSDSDDEQDIEKAWEVTTGPNSVVLPVYYHWEFTTGPAGDFESLVRRLEPQPLTIGTREIEASDPLRGETVTHPAFEQLRAADGEEVLTLEGMLRSPPPRPAPKTYSAERRAILRMLLNESSALIDETGLPADDGTEAEDTGSERVLGPPTYGQWQAAAPTIPADDAPPRWLADLNVDPRYRTPAGFGTLVIQNNQEQLMAAAWKQVGSLRDVNQLLRFAQLSREAGVSIHTDLKSVPAPEFLRLTGPVHARIRGRTDSTADERDAVSVASGFEASRLPDAALSPAFRRVSRPTGPLARRFAAAEVEPPNSHDLLTRLADGTVSGGTNGTLSPGPGVLSREERRDGLCPPAQDRDAELDERQGDWEEDVADAINVFEHSGFCVLAPEHLDTVRTLLQDGLTTRDEADETSEDPDGGGPTDEAGLPSGGLDNRFWQEFPREALVEAKDAVSDLEALVAELCIDGSTRVGEWVADRFVSDRLEEVQDLVYDPLGRIQDVDPHPGAPHFENSQSDNTSFHNAILNVVDTFESLTDFVDGVDRTYPTDPVAAHLAPAVCRTAEPTGRQVDLEGAASDVLDAIDPELTVPNRIAQRVDGVDLSSRPDPLDQLMAVPVTPRPMYKPLAAISQEYLLPGVGEIPQDSVTGLETNPANVEAYMVGLSHEMAREALYRELPVYPRWTFFREMWDSSSPGSRFTKRATDMDHIRYWDHTKPLGWNVATYRTAANEEDVDSIPPTNFVLLVRGELLRRYPNTNIYLTRAIATDTSPREPVIPKTAEETETLVTEGQIKYPIFRGTLDPDITFFGFDITPEEVRGTVPTANGEEGDADTDDLGQFVVFEEPATEPRFGLDTFDADDSGDVPAGITRDTPGGRKTETWEVGEEEAGGDAGWDAIGWGHLAEDTESAAELDAHLSISRSRPGMESWSVEATDPTAPPEDAPAWIDRDAADWGLNSAHMARITWQRPVRIAIHGDDMLPTAEPETEPPVID